MDMTFSDMQILSVLLQTRPFSPSILCVNLSLYEKVRTITHDQLCPFLSPCHPSVHLSLPLYVAIMKNDPRSLMFIRIHPSVTCNGKKAALFYFWYNFQKAQRCLLLFFADSIWPVSPNTLGSLMITCPWTCRGI